MDLACDFMADFREAEILRMNTINNDDKLTIIKFSFRRTYEEFCRPWRAKRKTEADSILGGLNNSFINHTQPRHKIAYHC